VAIDFSRSFMTWAPHDPAGNVARIQLDAACTLTDAATGASETFYLIVPCRSERMYADGPLYQMPNYEFGGIWSENGLLILRTHWTSARDGREYGEPGPAGAPLARFRGWRLDVRHLDGAEALTSPEAVVAATLANRLLVARTELRDAHGGTTALLEYPVKTMNVARHPDRWQVDTGPLIAPDPDPAAAAAARPIERLGVAHAVYNRTDRIELIFRRPTPIGPDGGDPSVTDFSAVHVAAAGTTLLAAAG
jgi:hypothetical protein